VLEVLCVPFSQLRKKANWKSAPVCKVDNLADGTTVVDADLLCSKPACWCLPAMASDEYYLAGVALAVCLVHDGPGPRCLSSHLFSALTSGPQTVSIPLQEMPQSALKHDLELVPNIFVLALFCPSIQCCRATLLDLQMN